MCDQLMDILLVVGDDVIRNKYHQASASNPSGLYVLVVSLEFTSFSVFEVAQGYGSECYL